MKPRPRRQVSPGVSANRSRRILEWAAVVLIAVLVAGGLRAFVVQSFFVPSGSMLPTLQIGDRIIVTKVAYTIHRGDIIVFRRTPADTSTTDADLVKRVIGLPGETISSRGATVLINGKPLTEPWLPRLIGKSAETAENIPTNEDSSPPLLHDGGLPWILRRQPSMGHSACVLRCRQGLCHRMALRASVPSLVLSRSGRARLRVDGLTTVIVAITSSRGPEGPGPTTVRQPAQRARWQRQGR